MLARGPVDLSFLKSDLFKYLGLSQATLDFKTLEAHLNLTATTLNLTGKEVAVKSPHKTVHHISIQSCHFELDIRNLVTLKPPLKAIKVQGAHIQLLQAPLSRGNHLVRYDFDQDALLKRLDELAALKTLEVNDATLAFVDRNGTVKQEVFVDAQIKQAKTTLQGTITLHSHPLKLHVALNHAKTPDLLKITGQLTGLRAPDISTFFADIAASGVDFKEGSLNFNLLYHRRDKKIISQIAGQLNHLTFLPTSQAKHRLEIPHLTFTAKLHNRTLVLEKMYFLLSGIPLTAQGQGYIDDKKDQIHYHVKATVGQIPLQKLHHFWPHTAGSAAREWVTTHLTAGQLSQGLITLDSILDFSAKQPFFTLKKLDGQFQIKDATLSYLKTMPPITHLNADAHFDQSHFNFHIHAAKSHDINLTNGTVWVGDFHDTAQHLTFKTDITGTLPAVLALIDHPPLAYAQVYNLDKQSAGGQVKGTLSLSFPLTLPFQAEKLQSEFQATVENGSLNKLAGLDLTLKQGALEIDGRDGNLKILGTALLNDLKTEIDFTQNQTTKQHLILKATLTPKTLNNFWQPGVSFFQGRIPVMVTYTSAEKGQGNLEIQGDLQPASLNLLTQEKPLGKPGQLSLFAKVVQGQLTEITDLSIKANNNTLLKGHLTLFPAHKQGTFIWENHGKETLRLNLNFSDPHKTELKLTGHTVDLAALQKLDLTSATLAPSPHTTLITLDVKKFTLGQPLGFLDNHLQSKIYKGQIQSLRYQGRIESIPSPEQAGIFCEIFHNKAGLRQFRGQCEAGGALLSRLNIAHNVNGGLLRLLATHDPSFSSPDWIGKIKFENFSVSNAPFLTRFFSLVFPTGITDLSQDGGMKFNLLKLRFGLSPEAIKIHGARAFGNSLGFSFHGLIHRGELNTMNLSGSMIPAYALNSFVANIPLIGRLLTGGKDEGLLGISFTVAGTADKPKVTANPFSVLTPGILRKLFSSSNPAQGHDDIWLDQDMINQDIFDHEFLVR
jgi:Predicted membrane protein